MHIIWVNTNVVSLILRDCIWNDSLWAPPPPPPPPTAYIMRHMYVHHEVVLVGVVNCFCLVHLVHLSHVLFMLDCRVMRIGLPWLPMLLTLQSLLVATSPSPVVWT